MATSARPSTRRPEVRGQGAGGREAHVAALQDFKLPDMIFQDGDIGEAEHQHQHQHQHQHFKLADIAVADMINYLAQHSFMEDVREVNVFKLVTL